MAVDPARFGMPDATTAGVQSGTTLKPYTGPMIINTNGAVIENVIIDGTLTVKAENVTIKNCVIQNFSWWGIEGEHSPNLRVEHCDFKGLGRTTATNSAILGSGTFIGNDIQGVSIGIQLTDGASVVRDNYIHDLVNNIADPHYDGITALGRQDHVLIEHNTIFAPEDHGTASLLIANIFGPVNDVVVRNNLMFGNPSYAWYSNASSSGGPITGVVVEDNYVERGAYGYYSVTNSSPTIRNNVQWQEGVDPTPYPTGQTSPTPPTDPTSPTPGPTSPDPTGGTGGDHRGQILNGTSHSDILPGSGHPNTGDDTLYGGAGDDILCGGAGADKLDGGSGTDVSSYRGSTHGVTVDLTTGKGAGGDAAGDTLTGIEGLTGSTSPDVLTGNSGSNLLNGRAGSDVLKGMGGNDVLSGGRGADTLSGGAGDDRFVFNTQAGKDRADTITDFNSAHDTILLDHSTFPQLGIGHLSAANFHAGSAAADGNDYVVYDQRTGSLYYDADGSGGGSATQIASLVDKPVLTNSDFLVF